MALMILLALSNEARNKNLNAINITNSILKKNIKSIRKFNSSQNIANLVVENLSAIE